MGQNNYRFPRFPRAAASALEKARRRGISWRLGLHWLRNPNHKSAVKSKKITVFLGSIAGFPGFPGPRPQHSKNLVGDSDLGSTGSTGSAILGVGEHGL